MGCSNSTMKAAVTPRPTPTMRREKTGFVAFEIDIANSRSKELNKNIDQILSRPLPPKRLQALEPLDKGPKLTAEELERRLVLAEEKRQRNIDERLQFNRRSSLRRQSASQDLRVDSKINDNIPTTDNMKSNSSQFRDRKRQEHVIKRQTEDKQRFNELDELESEFRKIDCKESSEDESVPVSGKRNLCLPPIAKTKLENTADSSGYSSRNISATQAITKEHISKLDSNDESSSDIEYSNPSTNNPKTNSNNVINFKSQDLSEESFSDFDGSLEDLRLNKKNGLT